MCHKRKNYPSMVKICTPRATRATAAAARAKTGGAS
jgi:hypothetical protein